SPLPLPMPMPRWPMPRWPVPRRTAPPRPAPRTLFRAMTLLVVAVGGMAAAGLTACGASGGGVGAAGGAPRPAGPLTAPPPPDPARLYRSMGLIAHGEPFPITGRLAYLAAASPETTYVVLTIALANRALTFTHDGDRYRAGYAVDMLVRQHGDSTVRMG